MARTTIYEGNGFKWIDLVNPNKGEFEQLALEFNLHPLLVQDCLDARHLPKYENVHGMHFTILRAYDENSQKESDSIQELTRKLAIFFNESIVITIHRLEQTFLNQIIEKWMTYKECEFLRPPVAFLMEEIINDVVESFREPSDRSLQTLDSLEMSVFSAQGTKSFRVEDGYYLKRQAFVYKRLLKALMDLMPKLSQALDSRTPHFQNAWEVADSLNYFNEEVVEGVTSLLNLHISLASHRTNEASYQTGEIVRVLTIFSIFLLPLTVITGVYGMNFKFMPELESPYGYPAALLGMAGILAAIFIWLNKKGWLKGLH